MSGPEFEELKELAESLNRRLQLVPCDNLRMEIIDIAREGFCVNCGSDFGPGCHCMNDE